MGPSDHIIKRTDSGDEAILAPPEKEEGLIESSSVEDHATTEANQIPKQAQVKDDGSQKHAKKRDHKMVRFKIVIPFTNSK